MFNISVSHFNYIATASIFVFCITILYVRLVGLISFSKMSSVDFAITIAVGSLIASTILPSNVTVAEGAITIGFLFLIQYLFSIFRSRSKQVRNCLENSPIMLMHDGQIDEKALKQANLSKEDLMAKLREANVLQLSDVKAVIFETTGDVSVLHGDKNVDTEIIEAVEKVSI